MAPVDLPYLHIFKAKGRAYAYYRRRLPDGGLFREPVTDRGGKKCEPGAADFAAGYQALSERFDALAAARTSTGSWPAGSFGDLWVTFKGSGEWQELATKTRADYARLVEPLLDDYGLGPIRSLSRAWIMDRRDELAKTPRTANYLVAILRRLLSFAQERRLREDNPALKIKTLRTGPGYRRWTEAEIATMTGADVPAAMRLAVLLGLHTGQRQGDLLRLVWSSYDGQALRIRQRKSAHLKGSAEIVIPVHTYLKAALDAIERTTAVVLTPDGRRGWNETTFRHVFADLRNSLGLATDLHFHGLRHSAASLLAEAGCSTAEIQAITGHRTQAMVEHYTAGARQEHLARSAIHRLDLARKNGTKPGSGKLG